MLVNSIEENVTVTAKIFTVWNLSMVEVWSPSKVVRTIILTGESAEIAIELSVYRLVCLNKGFDWLVLVVYDTGGQGDH